MKAAANEQGWADIVCARDRVVPSDRINIADQIGVGNLDAGVDDGDGNAFARVPLVPDGSDIDVLAGQAVQRRKVRVSDFLARVEYVPLIREQWVVRQRSEQVLIWVRDCA